MEDVHDKKERLGLGEVYDFLNSFDDSHWINLYIILRLHQILYSKVDYPEFGGQFRNENCFYITIPGLSFFPIFFPLENIQLIFSLNFKNPTHFKMLGQCWGYNPAGRLWLFNSRRERDGGWGYSGKPSTGPFIHIQS